MLEPSNVLGEHATTGFHLIFVALLHDAEEGREQGEALGLVWLKIHLRLAAVFGPQFPHLSHGHC